MERLSPDSIVTNTCVRALASKSVVHRLAAIESRPFVASLDVTYIA